MKPKKIQLLPVGGHTHNRNQPTHASRFKFRHRGISARLNSTPAHCITNRVRATRSKGGSECLLMAQRRRKRDGRLRSASGAIADVSRQGALGQLLTQLGHRGHGINLRRTAARPASRAAAKVGGLERSVTAEAAAGREWPLHHRETMVAAARRLVAAMLS